mmetsp:Transcript_55441/g.121333  ORF Transcript_55441/g.121333 Transcript_55441/m.121333 type:complete len:206 (-) Transcript_55441:458-1075(-)
MLLTSLVRCSANWSTTTATIRFSTPKTIESWEPQKMNAAKGLRSINGTATLPQESIATTVLKRRRLAFMTLLKDRSQKLQSCHTPSATSTFISMWSISTANIDQAAMQMKQKRNDQNKVLKQLVAINSNFRSSFSIANLRKSRSSLRMRTTRRMRRRAKLSPFKPTASKMIWITPAKMIKMSSCVQNSFRNEESRERRLPSNSNM